jgi:uncharacterized protein (PEP-CTERM system associated)
MMSSPRSLQFRIAAVPVAAVLVMASVGTLAQESVSAGGPGRAVSMVPRVSFSEILTDNVRLASVGRQSEQITEISPGIRINVEGARLKGYFDYALNQIFYAQNSSPSRTQNALSTFGTLEAVDNWAFVDFSGSISQQAVSAFGTQSIDNTSLNANRAEVSSYRISPYVRGRLGDLASYNARYSRTVTGSDAAAASGVATVDGSVGLTGDSAFRNLGWSADASQQRVDFSAGRPTEADRLNLGLAYSISPQLRVSANVGREANNYTSFDKQNYNTSGVGVDWSPSERTKLSATRSRRSFGDAHSLSFEHRTARTAWRFSDSKDVSVTPNQFVAGVPASNYDLLYNQWDRLFISAGVVDAAARAQLITSLLGSKPVSSFLTSALSLQRRQDLSFAVLGVRDTITFIATRSESTRLDTLLAVVDDLTTSAVVRQRGFSVNYSHLLTPDYSLGVLVSQQNTSGATSLQDSRLRFINASVTGKVGKQATAAVGVRRVVSSGSTAPYVENAITGNLNVQF